MAWMIYLWLVIQKNNQAVKKKKTSAIHPEKSLMLWAKWQDIHHQGQIAKENS